MCLTIAIAGAVTPMQAQNTNLQTAGGGLVISGGNPNGSMSYGNVNGLGIAPPVGTTVISTGVTGGVYYTTPYGLQISGAGGQNAAVIRVSVTTNFTHAPAVYMLSCYPTCTSAGSYSVIPLGPTEIDVVPVPGITSNQTAIAYLALFVSNTSSFTGTDTAVLTFHTYAYSSNAGTLTLKHTNQLTVTINNTSALSFVIATAASAPNCAIADPGSGADYSFSLGDINGLGVPDTTSASPCTTVNGTVSPPVYYTQYAYTATFTGFASTSATLQIALTTNFAKSFLELREASAASGLLAATTFPESIAVGAAQNGVAQTRFIGVAVTPNNGAATSAGADSAILTYTLTVP